MNPAAGGKVRMAKIYYQDEWATIYHGDCREVLPELEVFPVLITDPVWPNCPAGLLPGADHPVELFSNMLACLPSLPIRMVVVMRSDSDPRFLNVIPSKLPFFRCQILPYVMPGYIGRKLGGDEIAYSFGEPIPSVEGARVIPGYAPKVQPQGRLANGHPCSRALSHFKWLLKWWALPGETVLDPFCGSGTTLHAARESGLRSIGIEIEEKYCDIAANRLRHCQQILFTEALQ